MRVVASFLLIGYIISLLLKNEFKKYRKNILVILISFFSVFLVFNIITNNYFKVEINKDITYPPTHFIMMGLNTDNYGVYSSEDVYFTSHSKDKVKDNLIVIKERLKNNDLDFYIQKFSKTWANGTHYGDYFYQILSKFDDSYSFLVGENKIFINFLLQIMLFTIFSLFFIAIIKELDNKTNIKNSKIAPLVISIFGAIVFYLFWESLGRYSMSFLQWIIIGGSFSIEGISNFLEKKCSFKNKDNIKIRKKVGFLLIFIMAIILIDGYKECSLKQKNIDVIRSNQYIGGLILGTEDNILLQDFKISNSFNKIELKINDRMISKKIPYKFELYDINDKLIYEEKFMTTYKKGTTTKIFNIPRIYINSPTKFYFKIYSDKATKNNYLSFASYMSKNCQKYDSKNIGYDIMPDGNTYLNNKKMCAELTMTIFDYRYGNSFRKRYYLIYASILLAITIFSVYEILIKKK